MGSVYRAKQIALDKIVALKVLSDELRDDPEFVLRFHTEARAASRLDHPHSTRVLDFGEEPDGLLYIAMELLDGCTLADLLDREFPLAPARIAAIMSQALSAVGAAHALKVLHRDLKPENIVILESRDDEDRRIDVVKVCDFGIAKLEGVSEHSDGASRSAILDLKIAATPQLRNATRAGVIVGTPQYMSPEQARGEKLDVRSDLYSLGVVLFEMLTRRAPFHEGTPAEVLLHHAETEPPAPSSIYPHVDPQLEAICLRALRKDRDARFTTAREMRIALRPLLEDATPALPPSAREMYASAPTISATAVAPHAKRSARMLWAGPALAIVVGAYAVFARRAPQKQAHDMTPALPVAIAAAQPAPTRAEPPAPTPTETPAPTRTLTQTPTPTLQRVPSARPQQTAPADPEPPPPPVLATVTPPPPTATVTATATSSPPPQPSAIERADPARVHVDLGPVQADRVSASSVESALRHVDFTSCYRAEVAQSRSSDGTATLAVEMDEERVTRAELVGGPFASSLRQCISQRALGTRVRSADTGAATARVTLRFALR